MSVTNLSSTAHNEVLQAMDDFKLPDAFYPAVEEFYLPIAAGIASSYQKEAQAVHQSEAQAVHQREAQAVHQREAQADTDGESHAGDQGFARDSAQVGPQIVGIQGSQGSGKSTCAAFLKLLLEHEFGYHALVVSIDDFYLTRSQRAALAEQVHPLFMTRGVPATHDTELIESILTDARGRKELHVPIFDKSVDDRAPENEWQCVDGKLDIVILEGWCVGLTPQHDTELMSPVNDLERLEDADGVWRRYVNDALHGEYANLFAQLNTLIALQAPSFECVHGWRLLQEQKMVAQLAAQRKDASKALTQEQLKRFIAHYQRLTEHALRTMPMQADYLLTLKKDHTFGELRIKAPATVIGVSQQ